MPTNDERREVAERLREIDSSKWCCYGHEFDERMIASLMTACGCNYRQDWQDMCLEDRLADLIEPEPERTCEITASDDGLDEAYDGSMYSYAPPTYCLSCGHNAYECEPYYCPVCGAKVVE